MSYDWGKTMSEDTDKKNDRLRKLVDSEKAHAAEYYRRARRAEAGQLRAVEEIGKLRAQLEAASTMPHSTKPGWQGLTDEEIHTLDRAAWKELHGGKAGNHPWSPMLLYFYEGVEAKLREKNNG